MHTPQTSLAETVAHQSRPSTAPLRSSAVADESRPVTPPVAEGGWQGGRDGGGQVRDKATSLIKSVFPDAEVSAEANHDRSVSITEQTTNTKVVTVSQRDLYRKYRWPAADTISSHLQLFKEEMQS